MSPRELHARLAALRPLAAGAPALLDALDALIADLEAVGPRVDGVVRARCPACGVVDVAPDLYDRGVPASGPCPDCGARVALD